MSVYVYIHTYSEDSMELIRSIVLAWDKRLRATPRERVGEPGVTK